MTRDRKRPRTRRMEKLRDFRSAAVQLRLIFTKCGVVALFDQLQKDEIPISINENGSSPSSSSISICIYSPSSDSTLESSRKVGSSALRNGKFIKACMNTNLAKISEEWIVGSKQQSTP